MLKSTVTKWAAVLGMGIAAFSCQTNDPGLTPVTCATCPPVVVIPPVIGPTACTGPDIIVNSVIAYGTTGNVMDYGVAIKNVGNASAILAKTGDIYWQAWLSTDGVTRNVAACGQSFSPMTLAVNQITWTSINCTFPASVNFNNYHYFIVDLHVAATVGECNSSNNTFVRTPLPL
jgi:hypothetical protein